jgi:hypothetical protein
MGKHLLAKAHIANLNELTESEVTELTSSTVDETALGILKTRGSRGITIVSLQRKTIFDIQLNSYWPKWQTKHSELSGNDFETSELHKDMCTSYLIFGFVSAQMPWDAMSNLELRRSYQALRHDLVLLSATTLSLIWWREYAVTLVAIKKQLPLRNIVSLALDRWTSMNKLAITSVITYYMAQNWPLDEVQLAFGDVNPLFSSRVEC